MDKIEKYLGRIDRNTVPANKASLKAALPAVLASHRADLVGFFCRYWHRSGRCGAVAARALASAFLAGGRGPTVLVHTRGFREFSNGGGTYTHHWEVGFTTPPVGPLAPANGRMAADDLFGRGGDRQAIRLEGGRLVIDAEQ